MKIKAFIISLLLAAFAANAQAQPPMEIKTIGSTKYY